MARRRGKTSGGAGKKSSSSSRSSKKSSSSSRARSTASKARSTSKAKKSSPKRSSPKPSPRRPSTNNPQVSSQNIRRPSPISVSTNNPQVATQNTFTQSKEYQGLTLKQTIQKIADKEKAQERVKIEKIFKLPAGTLLSVKSPQNPNQNQNVSTFESLTIDISGDKIHPQFQKEIQQHLSGEKQIDPQRLQAIQEGRIIVTEGIKTTFTPTDQQLRILKAMEKQKQQEKEVKKQQQTTYTFEGKDVTQQTITALEKQRKRQEEQKRMSQEMRNRSNEEILKNFIKVQTQKEQQGLSPDTNLNKYLTERGYDISKPETIPTSALKPTKLDTAQKMLKAGLHPSIINMRLQSMGLPLIENPNNLNTGLIIDTNVPPLQSVNYTGIRDERLTQPVTQTVRNDFIPPVAQNTNKPVGKEVMTVSTEGLGSVPQASTTQIIAETSGKVEGAVHQLPLPLLAGILFLGL